MTDSPEPGLIEYMSNLIGGGATALLAGMTGRLMWHATEVRAKRRALLDRSLVWELPLAFGMALIGDGLGAYLGLSPTARVGLIAALSYLGPRGTSALFERWLSARRPGP